MAKGQQAAQQKHRQSSKRGRKAPPSDVPVADKGKGKEVEPESAERARLRQAIKDLGGDDEDMELLKGIEEEGEEEVKGEKQTVDEKSLKSALSSFMKELNFSAVAPELNDEESEEEEDEEEGEDDEAEDEEDEEDDDDEDDEEEGEEGEDAEAAQDDEEEEEEEEDEDESEPEPVAPAAPVEAPQPEYVEPEFKKKSGLQGASGSNIPASPIWTELAPPLSPQANLAPLSIASIDKLRNKATKLLASLPPLSRSKSSSDATFLNQILSSGTHQDKLSALVLLVRESPVHAVRELEKLRSMAGFKDDGSVGGGGRDERVSVVRALSDWWVTGGGKEQGKLRYFADQPMLSHPEITDRHLVLYAFEDFLKKWFFNLLQVLEALSHDTLPFVRTQALNTTFQLLAGNAEQEQNLLRLGVNKLGDTDKAVASKASHHLLQLLQTHPAMKAVVARDVATLVLKPPATGPALPAGANKLAKLAAAQKEDKKADAASHARYYGLITLNQMTLTVRDRDVAGRLVETYFEVFREILGDGTGPEEEPVVEGAETIEGKAAIEKVAGKVEKWRGRRKGAKPKNGRQTNKVEESLVEESDAKMVAAVLTGVNRALPFAKLEDDAFEKYMATLFKITHAGTFNTSIQALVLIFQVSTSKQAVSDRFYRTLYESLFDPRLVTSSKQAMYLNLLFKAMKADTSVPRVMAFVKRLLQMLVLHQPPFICGALFLLGELFNSTPGLKRMLVEPEDDSEEHFVDAPEEGETKVGETSAAAKAKNTHNEYDGRKRDPQFAGADASCLWELTPFLYHFHPTVSLHAQYLLKGEALPAGTGSSDISLNTLVSFLDRFVYRNPKKQLAARGASIMQPAAAAKGDGVVVKGRGREGYVNDESFWRKKVEDVPADQLFFHKFFSARLAKEAAKTAQAQKRKGKNADDDDEEGLDESDAPENDDQDMSEDEEPAQKAADVPVDDESEDSDPEEAEIWKAMKNSMPSAGDEDLEDSDDLDEEMSDDDDEASDIEMDDKEAVSDEDDAEASSDDGSALSFGEEDDDLLSESEMPNIVLGSAFPPSDNEEEQDEEEDAATIGKRKRDDKKAQRKKRKAMPMFASADDYAALIDADNSGDGE